jgi:hypothetical protein
VFFNKNVNIVIQCEKRGKICVKTPINTIAIKKLLAMKLHVGGVG